MLPPNFLFLDFIISLFFLLINFYNYLLLQYFLDILMFIFLNYLFNGLFFKNIYLPTFVYLPVP